MRRHDQHRARGQSGGLPLVQNRPRYAQGHERLSQPHFVSKQDDLPALLVIVVVEPLQDRVDCSLLPPGSSLNGAGVAVPER